MNFLSTSARANVSSDVPVNEFACLHGCTEPVQPPFEVLALLAFALFLTVPILFLADWFLSKIRKGKRGSGDIGDD